MRAGRKLEQYADTFDEATALPEGPGLANLLAWHQRHPRVEGDVDPEEAERSSFWALLQEAKAAQAAKDEDRC